MQQVPALSQTFSKNGRETAVDAQIDSRNVAWGGTGKKGNRVAMSSGSPTLPTGTWAKMGKTARSTSSQGIFGPLKPRSWATWRKRSSRVELRIVPGETALTSRRRC